MLIRDKTFIFFKAEQENILSFTVRQKIAEIPVKKKLIHGNLLEHASDLPRPKQCWKLLQKKKYIQSNIASNLQKPQVSSYDKSQ